MVFLPQVVILPPSIYPSIHPSIHIVGVNLKSNNAKSGSELSGSEFEYQR